MRRTILSVLVLGPLAFAGSSGASACCMVPRSFAGDVDQSAQRVTLLHHDGHQELVIRVAPFFQGTDDTPAYLAWVLTVPSRPTGYATVDGKVFEESADVARRLERLAEWQYARRSRFFMPKLPTAKLAADGRAVTAQAAGGLEVSAPIEVGPYTITEVKARGADALTALNAYLQEREFPTEDPAHMRWFVENDFTFLCIHITPAAGSDKLGAAVELDPLRVGFATPRPYYPGMFSSRQGDFALQLTAFTSRPLARTALRATKRKLRASSSKWVNLWTERPLPGPLGEVVQEVSKLQGVGRWHVNELSSHGFNRKDDDGRPAIASWTEDVFFGLGTASDGPPSWYYGDRKIGTAERLWREHRYGLLVLLALAGLLAFATRAVVRRIRAARVA